MVPPLLRAHATLALQRKPACPDASQKLDPGTRCVHLPDPCAEKEHPKCYRETSGTEQHEGYGGALGD